jgi:hypothetical protein
MIAYTTARHAGHESVTPAGWDATHRAPQRDTPGAGARHAGLGVVGVA